MEATSVPRAKVRWVWFAGPPLGGVGPASEDGGSVMLGTYTATATGAYERLEATWELTRSESR